MKTKRCLIFLIPLLFASCAKTPSSSSESQPSANDAIVLNEVSGIVDFHSPVQKDYLDGGIPEEIDHSIADGKRENSKPVPLNLSWESAQEEGSFEVLLSEDPSFEKAKRLKTESENVEVSNLKLATTYYWKVRQGGMESAVSSFSTIDGGPRNLDVDGVTNVRDIGGWEVGGGKRIRQGLLYRGARLNNSYPEGWTKDGGDLGYSFEKEITEEGEKEFHEDLGIKTEIDLRLSQRNGYPGLPPEEELFSAVDGVNYIPIPTGGSANINACKEQIKQVFDLFAIEENYPIYFHCNIGTDRTGMIAYLLNAFLGVNEIDLFYDYMFSNFGLIAVPNAYDSDPTYKDLTDLTKASGASGVVNSFSGTTLSEKAKNCLLSCEIEESTLEKVRSILL